MVCGPWGRKESDTTEATEHTHGGEHEVVWCVTVIFTCISQIASEIDHIFIGFLAIWAYFFFGEMLVLVLFHFSFSLVFHLLICRGSLL